MLISICAMWCIIISLTICKAVRTRLLSHHYHHHHCPTAQHTFVVSTAIAVDDDSLKRERTRCRAKWIGKKKQERKREENATE